MQPFFIIQTRRYEVKIFHTAFI